MLEYAGTVEFPWQRDRRRRPSSESAHGPEAAYCPRSRPDQRRDTRRQVPKSRTPTRAIAVSFSNQTWKGFEREVSSAVEHVSNESRRQYNPLCPWHKGVRSTPTRIPTPALHRHKGVRSNPTRIPTGCRAQQLGESAESTQQQERSEGDGLCKAEKRCENAAGHGASGRQSIAGPHSARSRTASAQFLPDAGHGVCGTDARVLARSVL